MNKASGGDGIPVELFQILKYNAVKVLHSICQQLWKTQQWPQDWKRSVFIRIPKKGSANGCSNYRTIALISHASREAQYSGGERKINYCKTMYKCYYESRRGCLHLPGWCVENSNNGIDL